MCRLQCKHPRKASGRPQGLFFLFAEARGGAQALQTCFKRPGAANLPLFFPPKGPGRHICLFHIAKAIGSRRLARNRIFGRHSPASFLYPLSSFFSPLSFLLFTLYFVTEKIVPWERYVLSRFSDLIKITATLYGNRHGNR